jgi:6-pyruvoyltetrahydropterin/6-carboxytetrahydropterin synthase
MEITRKFEFATAHRLEGHEGVCANLHGHNYVALVSIRTTSALDGVGRILDFSEVKRIVGGWIDSTLDHNTIYKAGDPVMEEIADILVQHGLREPIAFESNPTVEVMAEFMLSEIQKLLPLDLVVSRLVLYETSNCSVEVYA